MNRFSVHTTIIVMLVLVSAACNHDGPTNPSFRNLDPASSGLQITPSSLEFGDFTTELLLLIHNDTNRGFDWVARPSKGWLSLPRTGRLAAGQYKLITVTASRQALEPGSYQASIRFESIAGNQSVPVTLEVLPPPPPSTGTGLKAIDATGTWDVTGPLNSYLASVPNGSVIQLPAGARYRVEGIVRLVGRKNLTIEGNGALLFANSTGSGATPPPGFDRNWPRNRYHLEIRGGSGIVIRNLVVRGANPNAGMNDAAYVSALEAQH
ncbi:MAG TPA: hypothetical protein VFH11_06655, partial [Gemmatimonadota bacterium]|nr:hypothetical protein [Gemmatimonadota bacterium]